MSPPPRPRLGSLGRAAPRSLVAFAACALLGASGCASGGDADGAFATAEARAERIRALESSVQADRDALAELVTRPRDVDVAPLHEDTALRTLAERLRAETAELERLRAEAEADTAGATR